ncbi:GDP-D-glucose phosphorylase 1 isoform X2 [Archocentrus centrarchus]|uniref:GDP-D-glucose phosphorylase 1 isoform X2 n=1 Tax=Archocentrus centrarchus TaxID=63155 RepID=UPI0011EA46A5|nr:GDP-D-glucose phosphorylase 1 isoform X2 [Archocentrus centrarchus]
MSMQFVYTQQDFVTDLCRNSGNNSATRSLSTKFDATIRAGWADRMARRLFRYQLGDLQTRILQGPHGYVAQLNIQRGIERRKPQEIVLTRFAIQVGIEAVLLSSDPAFRMGFNSLGAFASVNHLHLHGYYLDHALKIESKPAKPLCPEKGFYRMLDFPAGFLFYAESEEVEKVAGAICEVTDFLVNDNIAHNLFLTRGSPPCGQMQSEQDCLLRTGVRIAVWPRISCFGAKEESAFNVALCELAGHLPFKNKRDFEVTTENDVISIIQRYLLPDDKFHRLEQKLTEHLMCL